MLALILSFGSYLLVNDASPQTRFDKCRRGETNCVMDGDTFRFNGEIIRVADIDAPETGGAKCAKEAELGHRATVRLGELLSSGSFTLRPMGRRDRDRYGRLLRVVSSNGRSVGEVLVSEGLARPWGGQRRPWC